MDFEVTATRKRPQTLGEMVGQDFVVASLGNALDSGRIAPAYLLSGPRGTGKTSTARIIARSLNCVSGTTSKPCNTCDSCREITSGSSPDVMEIDGASNTSVNDVREIRDEILYPPQGAGKKIYVIDEVHMLSNNAFNALLKTIEEPPPYVVFIFATTEIHKVPATIRSRCQQFRFKLISAEIIRNKLEEAVRELERKADSDALNWIAREADGSLRDAYTLLDQILSFSGESIKLADIREKMGLVGMELISSLLDSAALGNHLEAQKILDDILVSGLAVEQVLIELSDILHSLMLLACGVEKESLLGISPSEFPENLRKKWTRKHLEMAAEDAFTLYRDIRFSVNARYELDLFVSRLCGLSTRIDAADVLAQVRELQRDLEENMQGNPGTGEQNDQTYSSGHFRGETSSGEEIVDETGKETGEEPVEVVVEETGKVTAAETPNTPAVQGEKTAPSAPSRTPEKENSTPESSVELVKQIFGGEIVED